jgi:hypothetical protein
MYDRVTTRNLLQRKNFHLPNHNSALCEEGVTETQLNLIRDCCFAQDCYVLELHLPEKKRGISFLAEISFASQEFSQRY